MPVLLSLLGILRLSIRTRAALQLEILALQHTVFLTHGCKLGRTVSEIGFVAR
jgi:hypothetical protein